MSKMFGIDWKDGEAMRMQEFYHILTLTNRRKEIEDEKASKKKSPKYGRH